MDRLDIWENRIIDYLNGELNTIEENLLKEEMKKSSTLQETYNQLSTLYTDIDQEELWVPTSSIEPQFKQMLDRFIEDQNKDSKANIISLQSNWKTFSKRAAVMLLIVSCGALVGLNISKQQQIEGMNHALADIHYEMNHLLQEESVGERIKAVNLSYGSPTASDEILDALSHTATKDKSPHVRLAAVEALGKYAELPVVKSTLVHALNVEKDPMVQINLINILSSIHDTSTLSQFDEIASNKRYRQFVRDEAHMGKIRLVKN